MERCFEVALFSGMRSHNEWHCLVSIAPPALDDRSNANVMLAQDPSDLREYSRPIDRHEAQVVFTLEFFNGTDRGCTERAPWKPKRRNAEPESGSSVARNFNDVGYNCGCGGKAASASAKIERRS